MNNVMARVESLTPHNRKSQAPWVTMDVEPRRLDAVEMSTFLESESIGKLKEDLPANEVIEVLGEPKRKGEMSFEPYAHGMTGYHQFWYYPTQGITLSMFSEHQQGIQRIFQIWLESPSQLTTKRGIKIGDPVQKVIDLYSDVRAPETQLPIIGSGRFMAGSAAFGLFFEIEEDRVVEIFLGDYLPD